MFHAAEAFLLRGSDKLAVAHKRRRRVAMKRVQTQNDHVNRLPYQRQASATIAARSDLSAAQPNICRALFASATRTEGSPARRGASHVGTSRPVTLRTMSIDCRTEMPRP